MTGTELATVDPYRDYSLKEKMEYVGVLARAGTAVPKALWTDPGTERNADGTMVPPHPSVGKLLLLAETGSMLGIHPMAALQGVYIVEGRPTLSANLLAALVRRAGHKLRVSTTGSWKEGTFVARAELIRSDDPDFPFVVEWSRQRAEAARLANKKGPWEVYPEAMCKARAITEVIREGASDVTLVPAYTPEELGARVDDMGDPIEMTEVKVGDVSRETPIVDEAASQVGTDPAVQAILDEVAAAETAAAVREVFQANRTSGLFSVLVQPYDDDREPMPLGQYIVDIGKALADAEEADVTEGEVEPDETTEETPATEDADVVDAVVVDDAEAAEAAAVAAHEAEEAAKAKPARAPRAKPAKAPEAGPSFEADRA